MYGRTCKPGRIENKWSAVATYFKHVLYIEPMKKREPKKDIMLRIRISQAMKDRIEREAEQRGITVSELIRKRLVRRPYGKGSEESNGRDRTGGDATGSARR